MKWTLVRDGLALAVHESGEGRPILLQHGLGGDARQVAEAWPQLPGWRCVTLECRGHGESPAGAASMEIFADDVAASAKELGPPVILGGISMGAALSLRLAVRRPELVRALVLIRPAWVDAAAPENLRPIIEVAELLRRWPPGDARVRFVEGETAKRLGAQSPDNLSSLLGYFDASRPGLADTLAAIAEDDPGVAAAEIRSLSVPTLVCGVGEDVIHPLAMAMRLARLVPGARFVELPPKGRDRAAHFTALHAALDDFLEDLT